jgi:hypothetical protein
MKHKIPRVGLRALPIHAKSGREWGPKIARFAPTARDDDDCFML